MFSKILIANRGEIAIRILRACKEMGIRTVAVYSEADKKALHVSLADESVLLGAPAPKESYLNIEKIISAAKQTGAQAIHPGYGFLSENSAFAEAVTRSGLTFIGPPAEAIRAMGDKAESKNRMRHAGVPTIPGVEGLTTEKEFKKAAGEIGYPVLVKAAAGGGGKGMRIVNQDSEMFEELEAARREAMNSFGDDRLLIEKFLASAHHIEFQVFGDQYGNLVHLFERECSVQRRHQKILEEAPSSLLTAGLRSKMGIAAVAAAKAVGYANAGTVEFIFDPSTFSFYFLEMNTRLQVEHPVTESIVGLDLVQWQIRIAAGEPFPFTQSDITQRGHAIECRIYAEKPADNFLPSTGTLLQVIEPHGPGIRLDSGITTGSEISHYYDPLLAKLIVYKEDRATAIQCMQVALKEYVIHGVATNIDFLGDILINPDFQKGEVTTRWVETTLNWKPSSEPSFEALIAASLAEIKLPATGPQTLVIDEPDPYSPWKNPSGFRMGYS